jgi:hypothetical protein
MELEAQVDELFERTDACIHAVMSKILDTVVVHDTVGELVKHQARPLSEAQG